MEVVQNTNKVVLPGLRMSIVTAGQYKCTIQAGQMATRVCVELGVRHGWSEDKGRERSSPILLARYIPFERKLAFVNNTRD